jgi:hypothetical protein
MSTPIEIRSPVPAVVSAYQAQAALLSAGVLDVVVAAVTAAGPGAELAWAKATEFQRASPMVAAIAAEMKWSDTFVDDLFRRAARITA